MNNHNLAVVNPDITCFKCLKETEVKQFRIPSMGWGSGFDNWSTQINLCGECYKLTHPDWWSLKEIKGETDWDGTYYEYESEILKFAKSLSSAGKELFWNRYASDSHWEPQDYIDYDLEILPHEKCKEYSVYSHQEIDAYKLKFPTCQHPVHVMYNDNSIGCRCPFGAFGEEGQLAGLNISDECYSCDHHKQRETTIREVNHEDYNDYEIYYKAKLNENTYKSKFE